MSRIYIYYIIFLNNSQALKSCYTDNYCIIIDYLFLLFEATICPITMKMVTLYVSFTSVLVCSLCGVKGESHQILKLAERKIQGLVSSCRKPTVQPATEAENGPRVVQMIPCMTYSLSSFGSKYLRCNHTKCS